MPNVILEAMAQGLAIIATDVGAVSEMVSTSNGWLIPAGDKLALADAMVDAIHCEENLLFHKKQKSLDLVCEKFTWETVIQKTLQSIQEIVDGSVTYSPSDKFYG
jgi:glycosyltransferase involved in cell wall biosynthesis